MGHTCTSPCSRTLLAGCLGLMICLSCSLGWAAGREDSCGQTLRRPIVKDERTPATPNTLDVGGSAASAPTLSSLRHPGSGSASRLAPALYEESMGAPLEETIKRVDAVLLDAMRRLHIPAANLMLLDIDLRAGGSHSYYAQRIALTVPCDSNELHTLMDALLRERAQRASLEVRGNEWHIRILGRVTHAITITSQPQSKSNQAMRVLPSPSPVVPSATTLSAPASPRLAIVIDDLGASRQQARELLAIDAPIVFSILPYTEHAREVAEMAHAAGREVLVHLPMEPVRYPEINPGEDALLTHLDKATILQRTSKHLTGIPHAVGVNNHMGSRFTQRADLLRPVLEVIATTEYFVLDSLTHEGSVLAQNAAAMHIPAYRRDVFLDVVRDTPAILHQLRKAEGLARRHGQAIAIGHPYPETIAALQQWARARGEGIAAVGLQALGTLQAVAAQGAGALSSRSAPAGAAGRASGPSIRAGAPEAAANVTLFPAKYWP